PEILSRQCSRLPRTPGTDVKRAAMALQRASDFAAGHQLREDPSNTLPMSPERTLGSVAEREGFEPPIRLPVCRISSAVRSTTLPPLRRGREGPKPLESRHLSSQGPPATQERPARVPFAPPPM